MSADSVWSHCLNRDEMALRYLETLPYSPYPVQEEALFAWFGSEEGVLVCAPTGTGKTLIAEAAAYEALHNGATLYYTTPLIALTDQKFHEMQAAAVRWGFSKEDVGLVTGNRRVNPEAKILVVVAEILLNRLLQPEAFDFKNVSAVVMDEFHSFADHERGIVGNSRCRCSPDISDCCSFPPRSGTPRNFSRGCTIRTSGGWNWCRGPNAKSRSPINGSAIFC